MSKQEESLGFATVLLNDLQECSDAFGTEDYPLCVERLRKDCIDLPGGAPIRTIVDTYYYGPWMKMIHDELARWKRENPFEADDLGTYQLEEESIQNRAYPFLADFIKKCLMDNKCIKLFNSGAMK